MKKYISLLIAVIICCYCSIIIAEDATPQFDASLYERIPGYVYDKFNKDWNFCAFYLKQYSNATIVVGFNLAGDFERVYRLPRLYAYYRDADDSKIIEPITGIQILAGENVYTAEKMQDGGNYSYIDLDSRQGKALLRDMSEVNGISVKLINNLRNLTLEIEDGDYLTLKTTAQLLIENNPWPYVLDDDGNDLSVWDDYVQTYYPLI